MKSCISCTLLLLQAHYRQDAECKQAPASAPASEAAPRMSELTFSLQNFQVDNQLLNASMPVVICKRERLEVNRGGGNQGLLKAAQREIERQRQGAPLLTVQCKRLLSSNPKSTEDSVVIKCVSSSANPHVVSTGGCNISCGEMWYHVART
jgi:hypothetical protein